MLFDAEIAQSGVRLFEAACAGRTDKALGKRDDTCTQLLAAARQQASDRALMVGVARIEMSDQHAGIEDDHDGQSSRKSRR